MNQFKRKRKKEKKQSKINSNQIKFKFRKRNISYMEESTSKSTGSVSFVGTDTIESIDTMEEHCFSSGRLAVSAIIACSGLVNSCDFVICDTIDIRARQIPTLLTSCS